MLVTGHSTAASSSPLSIRQANVLILANCRLRYFTGRINLLLRCPEVVAVKCQHLRTGRCACGVERGLDLRNTIRFRDSGIGQPPANVRVRYRMQQGRQVCLAALNQDNCQTGPSTVSEYHRFAVRRPEERLAPRGVDLVFAHPVVLERQAARRNRIHRSAVSYYLPRPHSREGAVPGGILSQVVQQVLLRDRKSTRL